MEASELVEEKMKKHHATRTGKIFILLVGTSMLLRKIIFGRLLRLPLPRALRFIKVIFQIEKGNNFE